MLLEAETELEEGLEAEAALLGPARPAARERQRVEERARGRGRK